MPRKPKTAPAAVPDVGDAKPDAEPQAPPAPAKDAPGPVRMTALVNIPARMIGGDDAARIERGKAFNAPDEKTAAYLERIAYAERA